MFDSGWQEVASSAAAGRLWSHETPGPELAAALAAAEVVELADDGGFDAVERLGGWEALASWAMGRWMRETAAYARDRQGLVKQTVGRRELEAESVAMEVAALARVAPRTGEIRVAQAICLVERLPRTLDALEAGRISLSHARVVIEQTEACTDEMARLVDTDLWDRPARDRTPTQMRETVRRIVLRLDPQSVRRRQEQARQDRSLRYWADDDGATGVVALRLPADQARGVYAVIDTLARTAGDPDDTAEPRTLAQKRADTARDLILDAATAASAPCTCPGHDEPSTTTEPSSDAADHDDVPGDGDTDPGAPATAAAGSPGVGRDRVRGLRSDTTASPVRAEVRVTVPWETLAGHSERPGEIEGHGPIPAPMARAMAADPDSIWRRLLTDPVTGIAAHLDARRYRPPVAMADFVRSRDLTCAAPGCRVPAARCDLDHVIAYDHTTPEGGRGRTRSTNLKPCCRRHHRLKTLTRWRCHLADDPRGGDTPVIVWASPSGHRWTVAAPALEPPPWDCDTDQDEPGVAA